MNSREFLFKDGTSDKFWRIELNGNNFSVSYGRSGTAGQTQVKQFNSDKEAQTAADKLIAEKVKKGYVETGNTSQGAASSSPASSAPASPKAKAVAKPVVKEEKSEEKESASPIEKVEVPRDWGILEERRLLLEPRDWLWATWRPRVIELRPAVESAPFDQAKAVQKLNKVPGRSYWSPNWEKAEIPLAISREEAHFWFEAMTLPMKYIGSNTSYATLFQAEMAKHIAPRQFDGNLSREQVINSLVQSGMSLNAGNAELIRVLLNLFAPLDLVQMWLEIDEQSRDKNKRHYTALGLIESACTAFSRYILPFLSEEEVVELQNLLRPQIIPQEWPTDYYNPPKIAFHLATRLGLHDELLAVVRSWSDDLFFKEVWHDHYHRPQEIVFGLGSAAEVEKQMRRLRLSLSRPEWVRAWLAHTEFSAPDWVTRTVLGATGQNYTTSAKDVAEHLTKTFALAEGPEIAPEMLQLLLESKSPRVARAWLDDHPIHTIHGLLPVAAGRGKLAEAAVEQLRSLKKRGAEAAIRAAAQQLPEDEQGRLQSTVIDWTEKVYEPFSEAETPEAIKIALKDDPKLKSGKITWIHSTDLPPVTFGPSRLNDEQAQALLMALRQPQHPLVTAIKSLADPASLDAFAWKLFERWLGESAPSKEKWAMLALGQLGGDTSAIKLTPLIRAWPGEAQHQRAITGLDVLRAIGTDTALMQINGIAQKVKFKGLQTKAVEAMEGIASDRGLSRAQLEDRVVPTLDLDENGTRIFDYGPRQFRVVLSPEMKPLVREEGATLSKPRPDLPKPTAKDDAAKAEAALADWKLLKKQLAEATKIQAVRLENAMVRGRRWTVEEFETLLVHHPLMCNLVRLVVWEAASGNRRATFRVVEDGTYADSKDEEFDLDVGEWAHVGIVHPLHLTEEEKSAWGEIFSDYEIVPPFAQLGRAIYTVDAAEEEGKEITRFKDMELPPQTVCFGLEKLGWERGPALDAGGFYEHYKYFEASDITACAVYEPGMGMGYIAEAGPQKITEAYFVESKRSTTAGRFWEYPNKSKAIILAEVDAVSVSEVLKDLTELTAKAAIKLVAL